MFLVGKTFFVLPSNYKHMANLIYKTENEYYKSYVWEKAPYYTFLSRVLRNKLPLEIAILPLKVFNNNDKLKEKWKNYRDNNPTYVFWNTYKWEKIWYRYFQEKLRAWMPMEEAIKKWTRKIEYLKLHWYRKRKKKNKGVESTDSSSNYLIEVTYSKEEASVIRNRYMSIIEETEERLLSCEVWEMNGLVKKADQLKKELEVFNKWNPL